MGDRLRCMSCGTEIRDGEPTWEVKAYFDPNPPRGVACSSRCADKKRNESKLRAILWYNSLANPFNSKEKND